MIPSTTICKNLAKSDATNSFPFLDGRSLIVSIVCLECLRFVRSSKTNVLLRSPSRTRNVIRQKSYYFFTIRPRQVFVTAVFLLIRLISGGNLNWNAERGATYREGIFILVSGFFRVICTSIAIGRNCSRCRCDNELIRVTV